MATPPPAAPAAPATVTAGVVNGLVEGDHNTVTINYNNYYGAVAGPAVGPLPNPALVRATLLPAPFGDLLDRTETSEELLQSIRQRTAAEVSGQQGIGKTALVRAVCRQVDPTAFSAGIVYMEQSGRPLEDVQQFLFDCFYDAPPGFKPVGARLLRYLQAIEALVVIDDFTLSRQDADYLRNSVPGCTIVVADESVEMTEGNTVALAGLPAAAGQELVERRLKRPLRPDETAAAAAICTSLGGNPLFLIQAMAMVAQGRVTLSGLADRLAAGGAQQLGRDAVEACTPDEKHLLSLLAGLGDSPAAQDQVAAISGDPTAAQTLHALADRGLVQSHSPSFTAVANVTSSLPPADGGSTLDQVVRWTETQSGQAGALEAAPLIEHAMGAAAGARRWQDVINMARRVEASLASSGRWGAWQSVLERARDAARELGDRAQEGWALHQLGTRSLGMEDLDVSRQLLSEAAAIRRAAGDVTGAQVSDQNLRVLSLLKPRPLVGPLPRGGSFPWALAAGVAAVLLLAAGAAVVLRPSPVAALAFNDVNPAAVGAGASGENVVIDGAGFDSSVTVDAGPDVTVSGVTSLSASRLQATFFVDPSAAVGPRSVTVTGSGGRQATCASCLTIDPAPSIKVVRPAVAGQGATRRFLQVFGSALSTQTQLSFGSADIAPVQLVPAPNGGFQAQIQVSTRAVPGPRDITVINPDGGRSTCVRCFTVNAAPHVDSAKPNQITPGQGWPVTLLGSGMTPTTGLQITGGDVTIRTQTYVSPGQIDLILDVGDKGPYGPLTITATNQDGGTSQCSTCMSVMPIVIQ